VRRPSFSVSGAGEDRSYEVAAVAVSAAITIASRATDETTVYVRDPDGETIAHVERRKDGTILIYPRRNQDSAILGK
jgi:hypothetical protein